MKHPKYNSAKLTTRLNWTSLKDKSLRFGAPSASKADPNNHITNNTTLHLAFLGWLKSPELHRSLNLNWSLLTLLKHQISIS